jgi:hypothetical protein
LLDGRDDAEGRSLFIFSALQLAADSLAGIPVRVFGGDQAVQAAADVLYWDTGLQAEMLPPDQPFGEALVGAALYVAVATSSTDHLPLAAVAAAGTRCLVAVQLPQPGAPREQLILARAAHDTRAFGDLIARALDRAPLPTRQRRR